MSRMIEIRSYSLKPGAQDRFERLFHEQALPMLERRGVDVIGFGASAHDGGSYHLIRGYQSLEDRRRSQDAFQGSAEWIEGPREAILACVEGDTSTVLELDEETIAGLRKACTRSSNRGRRVAGKPQDPPTIELDGARLRPLRAADADALHAYLREPVVTELTSYPVVSAALVEAMIERSASRWAAGELSRWGVALQHDDRLIGTCGYNEWSRAHRWAELAFDLAPAHWGRGLMRQAVAAVLQWAFRQDQVDRVHAFVRVDNARSEGLLLRSGFVREGCLRRYRVCRGQPHDFYVYSLLRPDWAAAQPPGADGARR